MLIRHVEEIHHIKICHKERPELRHLLPPILPRPQKHHQATQDHRMKTEAAGRPLDDKTNIPPPALLRVFKGESLQVKQEGNSRELQLDELVDKGDRVQAVVELLNIDKACHH